MVAFRIAKKFASIPKSALVATFLVANAFVWYLCVFKFLQDAAASPNFPANSLLTIIVIDFLCVAISAFLSSISNRFNNRKAFLKYWLPAGLLLSVLFATVNLSNFTALLIFAGFLGVYFGLGMPVCLGYFAASTEPQNRAKLGAIIILIIGVGFPVLSSVGTAEPLLAGGILASWLTLGLISLLNLKPSEIVPEQKAQISYRSVLANKTFLLYLAPWFMFCLINDLTMPINTAYFNRFPSHFGDYFLTVDNVIAGAAAVACGFLADKKGRKRLALLAFALLGVGYASLGIFEGSFLTAWFYVFADGIAWGVFSMLFLVTIWGDIAEQRGAEKYYILGILPYMLSNFTRLSLGTYISNNISESTVFSFASVFLFLTILPLSYAPETLCDKIIRNIDLNSYVNKALEKASKGNLRKPRKGKVKENQPTKPELESSLQDSEAAKLAQKYYY